ncbi:MAG: hypothetical protein ACE5J3_00040 [Methanosarcinales archaeon]
MIKAEIIQNIARDFSISEDALIYGGIIEYIRAKKRKCNLDRLEILRRYKVSSADELENKIKNGELPEHPTWEDLIVLENLEQNIDKLEDNLDCNGCYSWQIQKYT